MAPTQLQVTVGSATGLQKSKSSIISGRPSTYVVTEIIGKEGVRFQTPVVKQSFAPLWDFAFEIDNFEVGDTLQFTLMDKNAWPRSDKILGKACLTREDIHSDNCNLELALAACETNATLFLTVVVANAGEAHEQVAVTDGPDKVGASLEETCELPNKVFDHGCILDTSKNTKVGNNNCPVVVDAGEEGDDAGAIAKDSSEGTESTAENSEPLVVVPLQVHGLNDQSEPILAPCLPSPVIYSRKVNAPVCVSAEEFARALAGANKADSMEVAAKALGNEAVQNTQPRDEVQNRPRKSFKQIKIRRKAGACC